MNIVDSSRSEFEASLEHLKVELQSIRGNRANPSLVEEIKVEAYGTEMRLQEIAGITVPEPRSVQIQPWDKNLLKDIERSLNKADLNVGIKNDGESIHISLPPLTTETKVALIKVLNQKLEQGRVNVRQVREKVRERIFKAEKENVITEDDKYEAQKDLDEMTQEFLEKIKSIGVRKEEEISTV